MSDADSLYEIEMRDNPDPMREAIARLRHDERAATQERLRATAEAAWQQGMMDQFEADLLGKARPTNPYKRKP